MIVVASGVFIDEEAYRRYRYARENPDPVDVGQVWSAEQWIRNYCLPSPRAEKHATSYGYKHLAEKWTQRAKDWCPPLYEKGHYITNGALIQAAINLGYQPIFGKNNEGPNCYFQWKCCDPMHVMWK
jgi:hypothetical protein